MRSQRPHKAGRRPGNSSARTAPDHQELALAEIERAGRDEGDVIALGDEGVDTANRQAADQRLPQFCEKQTHLGTPPARRIAWLATLLQTEGRTTEVDPGTGFSAPGQLRCSTSRCQGAGNLCTLVGVALKH